MSQHGYDELPYADYCFPRTHPEHLFAVSALCGRPAPPFARCRVLELGCARGANLLPMALDLPESEFVGVDLSEVQVAEARRRAEALGLRNVSFRAESVEALSQDAPFDYVICHGVYSWVPPAARDAILAVCRERMRPGGVAYVSFNALPGWNALRTLRDFLLEHAPPGPAVQRVARARLALSVLDESLRAEADASIPRAPSISEETLVVVSAATEGTIFFVWTQREAAGVPMPRGTRILSTGFGATSAVSYTHLTLPTSDLV